MTDAVRFRLNASCGAIETEEPESQASGRREREECEAEQEGQCPSAGRRVHIGTQTLVLGSLEPFDDDKRASTNQIDEAEAAGGDAPHARGGVHRPDEACGHGGYPGIRVDRRGEDAVEADDVEAEFNGVGIQLHCCQALGRRCDLEAARGRGEADETWEGLPPGARQREAAPLGGCSRAGGAVGLALASDRQCDHQVQGAKEQPHHADAGDQVLGVDDGQDRQRRMGKQLPGENAGGAAQPDEASSRRDEGERRVPNANAHGGEGGGDSVRAEPPVRPAAQPARLQIA